MVASQKDYFLIGEVVVLHGGQWVVATVEHADPIRNIGPAPPTPFAGRCVAAGWVAVDLRTSRSIYLEPPRSRQMPKDVELGRAGFHDELCGWGAGSCAVGVNTVSKERVRNATPDSMIEDFGARMHALYPSGERWFLWRWRPGQGTVEPLDWYAPVDNLVEALEGTSYTVKSWHPPFESTRWSGRVHLHDRESGRDVVLQPLELESGDPHAEEGSEPRRGKRPRPTGESVSPGFPNVGSQANEWFGPTDDLDSVVVLNRSRWDNNAPVLWRIDLADELRVPWQHDRKAIEKRVGGPVSQILMIRGAKRPCRYLPLIILNAQRKRGSQSVLWMLDSKTGDLAGPQSLPWQFNGDFTRIEGSFEGITLHASHDGRLLTYYTDVTGNPNPPQVVVYDTTKKLSIASREPLSCEMPVGFDAMGNVILTNSYRVFRWRAPFSDDWEVVFSLDPKDKKEAQAAPPR
ncbi:MAG: hypothetical protein HQ581_23860 [Planctomycetes bacterium]|nr:hypothetical protein [Planctomycetota bacterium]